MTVGELRHLLFDLDQQAVVTLADDEGFDFHVEQVMPEEFLVRLIPGAIVTEEDLS